MTESKQMIIIDLYLTTSGPSRLRTGGGPGLKPGPDGYKHNKKIIIRIGQAVFMLCRDNGKRVSFLYI